MNKTILVIAALLLITAIGTTASMEMSQNITVASQECISTCKEQMSSLPDINTETMISDKNTYTQNGRCKCEYLLVLK